MMMLLAGVPGRVFIGDHAGAPAINLQPFCGGVPELERCFGTAQLMPAGRRRNLSSAGEPVGDLTADDGALSEKAAPVNTYFSYCCGGLQIT